MILGWVAWWEILCCCREKLRFNQDTLLLALSKLVFGWHNILWAKWICICSEVWLFLTLCCSSPKYWWLLAAAWKHQHCGEESHLPGLWSLRNPLASNNVAQEWVAHHLEQLHANPLRYRSWRADGNISLCHAQKCTPLALLFIFLLLFLFTVVLPFKEEKSLKEQMTKTKAHL